MPKFDDPWSDYRNDPATKHVVDMLTHMILQAELSPAEVRKCAMMAAIKAENMMLRPIVFVRNENFNMTPLIRGR